MKNSWSGWDKLLNSRVLDRTSMGAKQNSCSISAMITAVLSAGKDGNPKLCMGGGGEQMSREKANTLPHSPPIKLLLNGSISQPSLRETSLVCSVPVKSHKTPLYSPFHYRLSLCSPWNLAPHQPLLCSEGHNALTSHPAIPQASHSSALHLLPCKLQPRG